MAKALANPDPLVAFKGSRGLENGLFSTCFDRGNGRKSASSLFLMQMTAPSN